MSKDRNHEKKIREASHNEARREAWQMEDTRAEEVSVPAIRHVGPTLESDPEYMDLVGLGGSTPEAQIAEGGATEVLDMSELEAQGIHPIPGQEGGEPEPLITRLPGDTSSDPHTDVGPDNATTVQHRGERKRKAA